MEKRTPIKRSKELVSLSSEHHDALMFCWKIKTGIANGTNIERIASYLHHFYENELRPHFAKEEQYLFPLLPETNKQRMLAEKQHETLGDLNSILTNHEKDSLTTITDFSKLLEEHVRFEERELFTLIEKSADPKSFAKVAEILNKHQKKILAHWDDEFWTKK